MQRGKIYLLRGGHVLRCHGLWGGQGPYFAFQPPSHGVTEDAAGYSAAAADVIRKISAKDLPWLFTRVTELEARNLKTEATEIRAVIKEIVEEDLPSIRESGQEG
jgi:hypothetical protein